MSKRQSICEVSLFEQSKHMFDMVWKVKIVIGQIADYLSFCILERLMPVRLASPWAFRMVVEGNSRICFELRHYLPGSVCYTITDYDYFEIADGLAECRLNRCIERIGVIMSGDDDCR